MPTHFTSHLAASPPPQPLSMQDGGYLGPGHGLPYARPVQWVKRHAEATVQASAVTSCSRVPSGLSRQLPYTLVPRLDSDNSRSQPCWGAAIWAEVVWPHELKDTEPSGASATMGSSRSAPCLTSCQARSLGLHSAGLHHTCSTRKQDEHHGAVRQHHHGEQLPEVRMGRNAHASLDCPTLRGWASAVTVPSGPLLRNTAFLHPVPVYCPS